MASTQYRIGELADRAGVTKRTIHYYMGRGLLPSPEGAGLGTTYSDEHLYRIMLIKKLQDQYLPLDEIKKRLMVMSLEDVRRNIENEAVAIEEQDSRYFYTRKLGSSYNRIAIGFGVEINYPADNEKAVEIAKRLYQYAEKIMKEGI